MKRTLLSLVAVICTNLAFSQAVSTFEGFFSSSDSIINGAHQKLGVSFTDANAILPNFYDTAFGGYWKEGWAITNVFDTTVKDFNNLYGAITGNGNNNSNAYAIGKNNAIIKVVNGARTQAIQEFYVTNTTYAYHTIKDGNQFSKPFGGETGNDPDYFVLTVKAYNNGNLSDDSVNVFLADFRFENNEEDYIVDSWEKVDLSALTSSGADSLLFTLETTDVGQFGPNTPFFFAMDDFTTAADVVGLKEIAFENIAVFPNPADEVLNVKGLSAEASLELINSTGQKVKTISSDSRIDISQLNPGLYLLTNESRTWSRKIIVQ